MSELACNIVAYRPDPDLLAANFRPWHVEALLEQAAALIDSCQEGYSEYLSLDYAWNRFRTDLETQEKQLSFDRKGEVAEGFPDIGMAAVQDAGISAGEPEESQEESKAEMLEPENRPGAATDATSAKRSSLDLRAEAVQRKRDLSAPGNPFALDERRDLALKRLCRDYQEAINRACVAEEGLKYFYDHLGTSSPLPEESEALGASITNISIWIRNSIEWLAQYRQLEEAFTLAISVRSLLSRNAWMQLKQARDSFSIKLQVPVNLFRGHDNCRLQGVSASLIGEAGTVPWSMTLRLPDEAIYKRGEQIVEIDQSGRPSCFFGRLENRRSLRPLETCGVTSWMNASPIGRSNPRGFWSLEIFKPVGVTSESFNQVDDVVLEINAVGISQKNKS